jgi:ADP-heptose:LPS heptosyltransferase
MTAIPQSVLVTRHDKIGDFVLALPLCKAIKVQYPEVHLAVLVSPVNLAFAQEIEFIDEVVRYDRDHLYSTIGAIRKLKPDVSISCFIDSILGFVLLASGVKQRVGPATKLAQIFFNRRIKQRRSQSIKPEYAYNIDLGSAVFPELINKIERPLLDFSSAEPVVKRRIAFHPGFGGSSDGNLLLGDYLRLAQAAAQLSDTEVVFTFGPDDQVLREEVESQVDFPAKIINQFASLRDFCQFLQGCRLFVSTSTGPMHLAAAVNTPTLSFFGDSLFASSQRWEPVSDPEHQHNFRVPAGYDQSLYAEIEQAMLDALR